MVVAQTMSLRFIASVCVCVSTLLVCIRATCVPMRVLDVCVRAGESILIRRYSIDHPTHEIIK